MFLKAIRVQRFVSVHPFPITTFINGSRNSSVDQEKLAIKHQLVQKTHSRVPFTSIFPLNADPETHFSVWTLIAVGMCRHVHRCC